MTRLMEQAIDALRHIPDERQDEIARAVMQFAGLEQPACALTAEERADILEAKAEVERGEFATDNELRAIWAKHGLRG